MELSPRAYEIFNEMLAQLNYTSLSIDAFELTLLAKYIEDYEFLSKEIKMQGNVFVNKHGQIHPLQTQRNKTTDFILKLGDRFGLNPLARGKSKDSFVKEKKVVSKLDGFKK